MEWCCAQGTACCRHAYGSARAVARESYEIVQAGAQRSKALTTTSPRCNAVYLQALNGLYLLSGIIIVITCGVYLDNTAEQELHLFADVSRMAAAVLATSVALLAATALGVLATARRSHLGVLLHVSVTSLLLVLQIAFAGVMRRRTQADYYDQQADSAYLSHWLWLVERGTSDGATASWLMDLSAKGSCCGWNDAADADQNPAYLGCSTDPSDDGESGCGVYFGQHPGEAPAIAGMALALSLLQMCGIALGCCLVCRLRPRRRPGTGPGDYDSERHLGFDSADCNEDLLQPYT
ncbi:unnamed protein product [Phaeothamnion confervicola]